LDVTHKHWDIFWPQSR